MTRRHPNIVGSGMLGLALAASAREVVTRQAEPRVEPQLDHSQSRQVRRKEERAEAKRAAKRFRFSRGSRR